MARTPMEGIRKKAVAIVPKMLPAVERAYRTPALVPTVARSRATSLMANGEVVPIRMLGTANSATDASSGPSRGPRFQASNATSTGLAATLSASTVPPASASSMASTPARGHRSAMVPPR